MPRHIDVFNGDADGICALLQLRLAEARPDAELITGVKRDIALLQRARVSADDRLTVLDISLDKNRQPLLDALRAGAKVFYADHHYAGEIPEHPNLRALINPAAEVCTSLLVNGHLRGRFAAWAAVGAFGDNLNAGAKTAARALNIDDRSLDLLRRLGVCLNYNSYGAAVADLHFAPDDLFKRLLPHADPLLLPEAEPQLLPTLEQGYEEDLAAAQRLRPERATAAVAVYRLPKEAWARRVGGVFGNRLATEHPRRAHAVLTELEDGYLVSVRAPLNDRRGADELCRQFPGGGGRAAAAGINRLAEDRIEEFFEKFAAQYPE